ncbi:MAG TPA: nucleoside monophosphate kinase [Candidatus Saccharibacteria bacterium]|jgi:adenylate kinase|nr:nucleoside monophosphate kinase [Candidatus Saccharibacteria bacterium]
MPGVDKTRQEPDDKPLFIIMGPPGSGKSVQGQLIAIQHGWRWISTGQMLRETKDRELIAKLKKGFLADDETVSDVLDRSLRVSKHIDGIVLDGFPRNQWQVAWLIGQSKRWQRRIIGSIYIDVDEKEVFKRLSLRGRIDDDEETIKKRIELYKDEYSDIQAALKIYNINTAKVNGIGQIHDIHSKIEQKITKWLEG